MVIPTEFRWFLMAATWGNAVAVASTRIVVNAGSYMPDNYNYHYARIARVIANLRFVAEICTDCYVELTVQIVPFTADLT